VETHKEDTMENNVEGFKLRAEAQLIHVREERKRRIKEYWETLPKFKNPNDVPDLPRVDNQEWVDYYVPKLINAGAIPKKDLIVDQYYIGNHRNANVAKWNGNEFVYNRTKFNNVYEDKCNHFEDDDGFALFVPLRIGTEEEYKQNRLL
jgi:hypothetical protein